jgi:hypothetical protein
MADLDKIMTALRNAHAAGDTAAAKRLAAMAKAAQAAPAESPAMIEGRSKLSAMTRNPEVQPQPRSVGQALYDNLIGDPNDGVDSAGERFGRTVNDVAKATGAGVARGVAGIADLPGAAINAYGGLMAAALERSGMVSPEFAAEVGQGVRGLSPAGTGSLAREAVSAATGGGSEYKGKTTAGQYAGTVGEFLPAAMAAPGGMVSNAIRFGVIPGLASEAAGQAAEGTGWETAARVAGALAGGVLPGLAAKGASKMVSPYGGADPERLKLAQVLDDFGVPITAGQRVGNEALRRKEGLTAGGQEMMGQQAEAFTEAVLKTAGISAKRATPEVLDEAATRIGSVFDDVTRGVDVTPDSASITALSKAVSEYKSLAPTANQAPLVSNIFKDVTKAFRGGNAIPASTVNTWRSSLSKLTTSADAATREAARMALETVDDMLTQSLNAAGRADDVARLATARSEWRNFLAIQKSAVREGDGLLSPARVRANVIQQGLSAYARGKRGDLGALARAGGEVMDTLPNSGTPAGIRAMIPAGSLPAALGAAIGAPMGPTASALGAVAGLALPGVSGAVRMSRPVQNYLANQMLNPASARVGTGVTTSLIPFVGDGRNALAPR